MGEQRYRVLAVASHPVQYMSPIFRRMAQHPAFDLHVAYCHLRGAEAGMDPEFGRNIQWDVPLLEGYSWSRLPNRGDGGESFFGQWNPGIWKLVRAGGYDAVLSFTGYRRATFWIAWAAARMSKSAFLFGTDATALSPRDRVSWKAKLKKILWPILFRLADQVIVPSSGARELMLSLGLPLDRVTLTPYTVDNAWWMEKSSQVERRAVRESWGVSEQTPVILFCAKLQPWKRPEDLLRAFARADVPSAMLVFAGEGPLRGLLEAEALSLGVAPRVRFLGFVNQSQLPAVYTAADLMVLPSEYEPFAVVVNEAMCCGCPVAASDRVGAVRDLIIPITPQFVYPCGDLDALASILRTALNDGPSLQKLSQVVRAHIETWSPERNISATLEAIEEAVQRLGRAKSRPLASAATSPRPHE